MPSKQIIPAIACPVFRSPKCKNCIPSSRPLYLQPNCCISKLAHISKMYNKQKNWFSATLRKVINCGQSKVFNENAAWLFEFYELFFNMLASPHVCMT